MKVRYDKVTSEWLKMHPLQQTTVGRCEACGLFYKPSLGHRCKYEKRKDQKKDCKYDQG